MIKKYKGIKILDKPSGKLKKNIDKLTPDEIINSKNYYIVKTFAPLNKEKTNDYKLSVLYNKYNRYIRSAHVYFSEIDDIKNIGNAHIQIVKAYQRKGLATLLYDYIEKDLKIKLKPSSKPSKDAKVFWKNRVKLKNPYRKDGMRDEAKLDKFRHSKGYLLGLVKGLRKRDEPSLWPASSEIKNDYFWKGYCVGLEDSVEQLKLIPKSKLKSYIKELEEEIDSL